MNKDRIEYEKHMKEVVDKFASMNNNEKLYFAWMNDYLSHTDDRVSFYPYNERTMIDLSLSGELEKESVLALFKKGNDFALSWLKENTITFEEFKNKNK